MNDIPVGKVPLSQALPYLAPKEWRAIEDYVAAHSVHDIKCTADGAAGLQKGECWSEPDWNVLLELNANFDWAARRALAENWVVRGERPGEDERVIPPARLDHLRVDMLNRWDVLTDELASQLTEATAVFRCVTVERLLWSKQVTNATGSRPRKGTPARSPRATKMRALDQIVPELMGTSPPQIWRGMPLKAFSEKIRKLCLTRQNGMSFSDKTLANYRQEVGLA
jgi:hypothetical protein